MHDPFVRQPTRFKSVKLTKRIRINFHMTCSIIHLPFVITGLLLLRLLEVPSSLNERPLKSPILLLLPSLVSTVSDTPSISHNAPSSIWTAIRNFLRWVVKSRLDCPSWTGSAWLSQLSKPVEEVVWSGNHLVFLVSRLIWHMWSLRGVGGDLFDQ